jgi:hypothetical protein
MNFWKLFKSFWHRSTLATQCCNILVISWLYRTCWNNLAISLIMPSRLTACSKLVTTTGNKQCEHNMSTCNKVCIPHKSNVPTTCQQDVFWMLVPSLLSMACWQRVTRLLSSTNLLQLQVVLTTCYRPAIQQVVSDNLVATR